jgi:fibronectin type 3 domain-containing protein
MVAAPYETDYQWAFWLNLEEPPKGEETYPAIMVQHASAGSGSVHPTWGIEFREDAWYLVVTRFGGFEQSVRLSMPAPRLGHWYYVQLIAVLQYDLVRVHIDDELVGELPVALADELDTRTHRIAYDGSGPGNMGTLLLDDVCVESLPTVAPFFTTVHADIAGARASLSWTVNSDEPVDGFNIYRRTNGSAEELIEGPLPATTRHFEDDGLETGAAYRYVIGALKPDATIVRSRPVTVAVDALPAVVFGELRTHARDDAVELSWDVEINETIEGFRIYRRSGVMAEEIQISGPGLLAEEMRRFEDVGVSSGAWYDYRIVAVTAKGAEIRSQSSTVQVPKPPLEISQVFPNPFRSSVSLEFTMPNSGRVTVSVYDVRGKLVAELDVGVRPAGTHVVTWNGRDNDGTRVSAGTYFFKLEIPGIQSTRKAVLVR